MSQGTNHDFVAKGITTKPVEVEGEDLPIAFSRQALEGMARQVREGLVGMTPEHLSYLGPIARLVDAEVVESHDGHSELVMYGRYVVDYTPRKEGDDPTLLEMLAPLDEAEQTQDLDLSLGVEFRIFTGADADDVRASSPLPIQHERRYAELPPLEWVILIPVVWGAVKFAGAFFEELGRASASEFVAWIKGWSARSKQGDRDWILTLRFVLPDDSIVSGFIPVQAHSDDAERQLVDALQQSGDVASLAGVQAESAPLGDARQVGLIYDESGNWRLAWWFDGERVFKTHWFVNNCPDPERFLGRSLLEHSQGVSLGATDEEE